MRDHLVRHGLLDISGAPRSLALDYERPESITAVADLHGASFVTQGNAIEVLVGGPGRPAALTNEAGERGTSSGLR